MRSASSLNQSGQDIGLVYGSIKNPIRAIIKHQSIDCAICRSSARPATFSRCGGWLRQRKNVALARPAATGSGNKPIIQAICQESQPTSPLKKQIARRHRRVSSISSAWLSSQKREQNAEGVHCVTVLQRDTPSISLPLSVGGATIYVLPLPSRTLS